MTNTNKKQDMHIQAQSVIVSPMNAKKTSTSKNGRSKTTQRALKQPAHITKWMGINSSQFNNSSTLAGSDVSFIMSYSDPCGSHKAGLDLKKIPDGAFPISAVAEYRFNATLTAPFPQDTAALLTNVSHLYLQVPLLRCPLILLVNIDSEEFGENIMAGFCVAWANIQETSSAIYPSWLGFDPYDGSTSGRNFFTVLSPSTLTSLSAPVNPELGISEVLEAFRVISQGVEVLFNVADLVNQATAVMNRMPANASSITPVRNHVRGMDEFYLKFVGGLTGGAVNIFPVSSAGTPSTGPLSSFFLTTSNFPSPTFVPGIKVRNMSSSFLIDETDEVRYEVGGFSSILLVNVTTGSTMQVGTRNLQQNNLTNGQSTRMYFRDTLANAFTSSIEEVPDEMTVMPLPITTQPEMLAQNPMTTTFLMKDDNGVYLPNQIWQPVFLPQNSLNYRKIIFTNSLTKLSDLDNTVSGWFDSPEKNFGWGVINIQGMSKSAAPIVKSIRCDEQVPAGHSPIGAYVTRRVPKNSTAIEIAMDIVDSQPMGYTASYNGFGKLASLVVDILARIPRMAATASHVATQVANVCDLVSAGHLNIDRNPPHRRTAV